MLDAYHDVLQKQTDDQFVEEVDMGNPQNSPKLNYPPQVCVARESKTTH